MKVVLAKPIPPFAKADRTESVSEKTDTAETPALEEVERVYQGWTQLYRGVVRYPDGAAAKREIEHHGNGVAVLPFDPARRTVILVRQFRPPAAFVSLNADLLEAVAGIMESGSPEECARREAMEEAGLRLAGLEKVGQTWMMPGISTERIHFFLAECSPADRVGAGGGLASEHERVTVVEIGLDRVERHLGGDGPVDAKLFLLFQALKLRRPELFEVRSR